MTSEAGIVATCDRGVARETSSHDTLSSQRALTRVSPFYPVKMALDRCIAALLLIPALPLMGVLVALIKVTSKGPGVYSQRRVGRNGKVFTMYKLRSMRCDAEAVTGPVWTAENDPRITRVGHVIRKLHLDELPQLFNVLRGEMSLIGPRPERPEFVEILDEMIESYYDRLLVPPGITGLAQINLPPDTDLESVRKKLYLDLSYIREANGLFDLRILFCTLLRASGVPGATATQIARLERVVDPAECPALLNDCVSESEALPQVFTKHKRAVAK